MALTTPILLSKVAFDATAETTFNFQSIGGDQVVKNRLIIRNNSTNAIVYEQEQVSFQLRHIVPLNTLTNGTYYLAQIKTYNAGGDSSSYSQPIQFWCYTQPTISFTNIPVGNIIGNSSFAFNAQYDQLQDELLNSYIFKLYNVSQSLLSSSDILYVGSSVPPPTTISYTFSGFDDNTVYYIECTGQTINGTPITTGKVQFTVDYIQPNVFTVLALENNKCDGYITIDSNIILVEGESNPSPPTYISAKEVNLTQNGSWVKWSQGFDISNDFTMRIWGRSFTDYSTICTLSSATSEIKINYSKGYFNGGANMNAYIELVALDKTSEHYYTYSNNITLPLTTEQLFVWIRRINNVFEVILENRGVIV
ncbi:MAG: hypothetical protein WCO84_01455 [bacterium]